MKKPKQNKMDMLKDKIIGEITEYKASDGICEQEECMGDDCLECNAARLALEGCIGIVRSCIRE